MENELSLSPVEISDVEYVNKLVNEQWVSTKTSVSIRESNTNYLTVLTLDQVFDFRQSYRCGSGFFLEAGIESLTELKPIITDSIQTIVSFGVRKNEWLAFMASLGSRGVDRIVAPGEALDFSPIWDGLDLIREFTREVSIRVG